MDLETSADDSLNSFLTLEKECELSQNESAIRELSSYCEVADDECEETKNEFPIEVRKSSQESPLRGSCDYIKNRLDPNSAIVDLNDTLDAINYILERGEEENRSLYETSQSPIIISSDDDDDSISSVISSAKSVAIKSIEDESIPSGFQWLSTYNDLVLSPELAKENYVTPQKVIKKHH
jgi:hypothetical protein